MTTETENKPHRKYLIPLNFTTPDHSEVDVYEEYLTHARVYHQVLTKLLEGVVVDFRNRRITGETAHTEIAGILEQVEDATAPETMLRHRLLSEEEYQELIELIKPKLPQPAISHTISG